ncbi:mediator complex subunit [Gamsiella multidivaricata]|nr:mediator complex subunit [Gamsiella multidivaricata]
MDPWTASTAANGETEGLAAADLTYLAYSLASSTSLSSMTISSKKPIVPDVFVVQRIKDIRRIKGLELDVVLLQFWLAGLTGLAESNSSSQRLIWKSLLLVKVDPKYYVAAVFRSRRKSALRQLSFYRGILNECDESVEDGTADRVNILKAIAIGCQTKGLVRPNQLDILNDVSPSQDSSNNYKFIDSSSLETIDDLCGRTLSDFEHQEKLVDRIIQVCENACTKMDVFVLSKLCQTLDDNPMVLDLIHLLRSPSALLNPLERFVNNLQQNEDNDIDTCNSNLEGFGIVLILILTIIRRYELAGTSKPQMLLEISPSIFEQSLAACQAGVIDATTLNSGLDYFLQPCLLFVLIGVVQYLCEEILFSTPSSFPSTNATSNLPGSVPGQSMLSPIGHAISPLASRGAKPPQHMNTSTTSHGQGSGKSVASVAMLQSCLKSLLAGEAFPLRLMRLLKSEVLAVLEHQTIENDHQMVIIQERLAAASANYYPWSVSEAYDVPKLAQQTSLAYEAIVSGGRTSLIARREKGWHVFGGSCYHIDVDLFRTTLCYLGPAQFVTTILKQLLKAARTPHGRRAGAAMISTPLVGCGDEHLAPQSLLWTLIYQTLWIPVPGRLETFSQGKLLAEFVGMTLDLFQSRTLIQLRQNQLQKGTTRASKDTMDIDMVGPQAGSFKCSNGSGTTTLSHDQLERDAAVEPFRVMLDQRLRALEPITRDRPGFEGFAQGMRQYRQRHPPLTLPLHQPKKARRA